MPIETGAKLEERLRKSVKTLRMVRDAAETARQAAQLPEPEPAPRPIVLSRPGLIGPVQR